MSETIDQIQQRCQFANWDGDGANPVTEETAAAATILQHAMTEAELPSDVSPEPDGMIDFAWFKSPTRIVSASVESKDGVVTVYWARLHRPYKSNCGRMTLTEACRDLPGIVGETINDPEKLVHGH